MESSINKCQLSIVSYCAFNVASFCCQYILPYDYLTFIVTLCVICIVFWMKQRGETRKQALGPASFSIVMISLFMHYVLFKNKTNKREGRQYMRNMFSSKAIPEPNFIIMARLGHASCDSSQPV